MKLTIVIEMDNEAFVDEGEYTGKGMHEAARILDVVVRKMREEGTVPHKLRDINGNAVGTSRIDL